MRGTFPGNPIIRIRMLEGSIVGSRYLRKLQLGVVQVSNGLSTSDHIGLHTLQVGLTWWYYSDSASTLPLIVHVSPLR